MKNRNFFLLMKTKVLSCLIVFFLLTGTSYSEDIFEISAPDIVDTSSYGPYDAVSATLRKDLNTIYLFRSRCDWMTKYSGPLSKPQEYIVQGNWINNCIAIPPSLRDSITFGGFTYTDQDIPKHPAYCWIKNVIDLGNGELIGFVHLEYIETWCYGTTLNCAGGGYIPRYSIGIIYSDCSGDHWTFCGDIIRPKCFRMWNNIGGAASLLIKDSIYVYFSDFKFNRMGGDNNEDSLFDPIPSVARAKTSDVIQAARNSTTTSWKKYSNGNWNEDGLVGLGSPIFSDATINMHADAAYCSYLKKYLFVARRLNMNDSCLYLYCSADGLHWDPPISIAKQKHPCQPAYPFFASLYKGSNSDCSIVGKEFSVFYLGGEVYAAYDSDTTSHLPVMRVKMRVKGVDKNDATAALLLFNQ